MRVVVTGATGNVGSRVTLALAADGRVDEIVGLARRPTTWAPSAKVRFASCDVGTDDLAAHLHGADAVVHCAWAIQPSHDVALMGRTNVTGTRRVIDAAISAGVECLVHISSLGTYAPGPKGRLVDETWPTTGIRGSSYSRHKAEIEALLDEQDAAGPELRVVRLRPALVLTPDAAFGIKALFFGKRVPFDRIPSSVLRAFLTAGPARFQVLDGDDVGTAAVAACTNRDARGAYNLAADVPLGRDHGAVLGALRPVVNWLWALRALQIDPGWVDIVRHTPLISSQRAKDELSWKARNSGPVVVDRFLAALHDGRTFGTPPLEVGPHLV